MAKISIIYWSGTGNTEAMAYYIEEGAKAAGTEVSVIPADSASAADVADVTTIALGCPSMGVEVLEESVMEPLMCELDGVISGKNVALFGSYGWGNGEWMRDWEERIAMDGASVVNGEGIICNGAPDDTVAEELKSLGSTLASM